MNLREFFFATPGYWVVGGETYATENAPWALERWLCRKWLGAEWRPLPTPTEVENSQKSENS